ncbi:MAG: class I SAM-dependent methyltransferase [Magnetospirillum sp.]|nr:class I SAM-dependent methyltransferase [Magnetospirillum sp.]
MSPLCESFLAVDQLDHMEPFYPLTVWVCRHCFLMQLRQYVSAAEIFSEYAYFSSFSDAYLEHARAYAETVTARFGLSSESRVVELASNDGYLLQHFMRLGIPVLGVEPAANVARAAEAKGVPTLVRFFSTELAAGMDKADLVIGNNVLAQVPDLNDFIAGMAALLKPQGVATIEVPHLMRLIQENQYDTIYHEHFSYFSLATAERIFAAHGLRVFDVEEIWTHGGSLRLFLCPAATARPVERRVAEIKAREAEAGLDRMAGFSRFAEQVRASRWNLLDFLIRAKWYGKSIAGYGAPGKGNTLLNYCGIRSDILDYTVDRNPYKHGKYLPGTHIPIHPPEHIRETRPDYVLILPWNLRHEIMANLAYIRDWGGQFVVPIPNVAVFP